MFNKNSHCLHLNPCLLVSEATARGELQSIDSEHLNAGKVCRENYSKRIVSDDKSRTLPEHSLPLLVMRFARGPPVCLAHCSTAATLDGLKRFPASADCPRLTRVTSSRRYLVPCEDDGVITPRANPDPWLLTPLKSNSGSGSLQILVKIKFWVWLVYFENKKTVWPLSKQFVFWQKNLCWDQTRSLP